MVLIEIIYPGRYYKPANAFRVLRLDSTFLFSFSKALLMSKNKQSNDLPFSFFHFR